MSPAPVIDPKDADDNRMTAALSYLAILILVPLAVGRDSPFVRYHLNQGLTLFVFKVLSLPLACMNGVIALIPIIGWLIAIPVALVHAAILLSLIGIGIYNAVERQAKPLPVIGGLFKFLPVEPPPRMPPPQLPPLP